MQAINKRESGDGAALDMIWGQGFYYICLELQIQILSWKGTWNWIWILIAIKKKPSSFKWFQMATGYDWSLVIDGSKWQVNIYLSKIVKTLKINGCKVWDTKVMGKKISMPLYKIQNPKYEVS